MHLSCSSNYHDSLNYQCGVVGARFGPLQRWQARASESSSHVDSPSDSESLLTSLCLSIGLLDSATSSSVCSTCAPRSSELGQSRPGWTTSSELVRLCSTNAAGSLRQCTYRMTMLPKISPSQYHTRGSRQYSNILNNS